jgi:putative membrane protein
VPKASLFSLEDRQTVERAVRDAEQKTSSEIVAYVVARSDGYDETRWKGALLSALLCAPFAAGWARLDPWIPLEIAVLGPLLAGASLGWMLPVWIPTVRRFLAGPHRLARRARQRAVEAFVEREVFGTRERSGILVFLSLFERQVVLLADAGIHAKVEQAHWDAIVAGIVNGIRSGQAGSALAAAIAECGALLERHGLVRTADDRNELDDALDEREA